MTMAQVLGLSGLLAVLGFFLFAFRQGMRVKSGQGNRSAPIDPGDLRPPSRPNR